MSGTMDKIKAKVDNVLHKDGSSHTGTSGSDPTGPHDSRLGNKADPRVDSDQYGSAGNTHSAGGYNTSGGLTGNTGTGTGTGTYGTTGNTGTYGTTGHTGTTGGYGNTGSDPTGPHDSRLANKVDPRVDSDQYGSAGNTRSAGGYNTSGGLTGNTGSTGTYGSTGGYGNTGSDPTGPHDSRLANKADPRVDSDRYGAAGNTQSAGGYSTSGGLTGNTATGTGTGHHHGHHGHHAGNIGSGNASKTAGPHDSDLANKLDPRVDSDLDGSKTVGGNQTYQ